MDLRLLFCTASLSICVSVSTISFFSSSGFFSSSTFSSLFSTFSSLFFSSFTLSSSVLLLFFGFGFILGLFLLHSLVKFCFGFSDLCLDGFHTFFSTHGLQNGFLSYEMVVCCPKIMFCLNQVRIFVIFVVVVFKGSLQRFYSLYLFFRESCFKAFAVLYALQEIVYFIVLSIRRRLSRHRFHPRR